MENKVLWIFQNFKETVDLLPEKKQALVWKMIVNFAFDGEKAIENDLKICNSAQKMAFLSIKNLIKLRKKAGSQNGISNNISGLAKQEEPNIGLNIGGNIGLNLLNNNNNNKINNNKYKFIGDVIKLNEKDYNSWKEKYPLLDLDFELKKRDIWLANCDSPPKNWFISTAQYLLTENDKKQKEKDKRLKKWEDF